MSLIDSSRLDPLERFLSLTAFRQQLVANNLANIDTPGYRAKDILFHQEMARVEDGLGDEEQRPFVLPVAGLVERPDGNNVSMDREGLLLLRLQLEYKTGVELLRSELRQINEAINDGRAA
ncbi:MAG TPA: flagellar basal body protein [Candidatus Binatia bacterium]|nr:flagellar basal body protein [Candidatus Binatia bacterium]